jgi:hypothetical protein
MNCISLLAILRLKRKTSLFNCALGVKYTARKYSDNSAAHRMVDHTKAANEVLEGAKKPGI